MTSNSAFIPMREERDKSSSSSSSSDYRIVNGVLRPVSHTSFSSSGDFSAELTAVSHDRCYYFLVLIGSIVSVLLCIAALATFAILHCNSSLAAFELTFDFGYYKECLSVNVPTAVKVYTSSYCSLSETPIFSADLSKGQTACYTDPALKKTISFGCTGSQPWYAYECPPITPYAARSAACISLSYPSYSHFQITCGSITEASSTLSSGDTVCESYNSHYYDGIQSTQAFSVISVICNGILIFLLVWLPRVADSGLALKVGCGLGAAACLANIVALAQFSNKMKNDWVPSAICASASLSYGGVLDVIAILLQAAVAIAMFFFYKAKMSFFGILRC